MSLNNKPRQILGREQQKGIATILVVGLMGVAMTAVAIGFIYSLKSTQEKQVAVHASTHAQVGMWSGVEAFRRYLGEVDVSVIEGLPAAGTMNINLGGNYGAIQAKDITVATVDGNRRVSATIVNIHAEAQSSSSVAVTFEIPPGAPPEGVEMSASLDFYDDVRVTGGIEFLVPGGPGASMNVDGDLTIENISISDMNVLNSTGDLKLNGDIHAQTVFSNGNLDLLSGATVDKASALGNITSTGGGQIKHQYANGNISHSSSGNSTEIRARGSVLINSASHGLISAGTTVEVNSSGSSEELYAVGDITFKQWTTSDSVIHKTVVGESNVTCTANSWRRYGSMSVNGVAINCPVDVANIAIAANETVDVMPALTPFSMTPFVIDVRVLKDKANYAFTYDADLGRMQVYVSNINGLSDGLYDIGSAAGGKVDYLCATFDGSGNCTDPVLPETAVCMRYGGTGGDASDSSCISYNGGKWTLNGEGSAPGIMWFEGDVELGVGVYNNTFLVTGNVQSSGAFLGISVNYGGYSEVCEASASRITHTDPSKQQTLREDYTELFENQYPTNLCDGGVYKPITTGNIGIAAGSFDGGDYIGGNINLTAKNEIFGSILAGNYFDSSGDTTVHGYVTAAGLGQSNSSKNRITAKTIVDLEGAPTLDQYNPNLVPLMEDCEGECEQGGSGADKVQVLWTRYL